MAKQLTDLEQIFSNELAGEDYLLVRDKSARADKKITFEALKDAFVVAIGQIGTDDIEDGAVTPKKMSRKVARDMQGANWNNTYHTYDGIEDEGYSYRDYNVPNSGSESVTVGDGEYHCVRGQFLWGTSGRVSRLAFICPVDGTYVISATIRKWASGVAQSINGHVTSLKRTDDVTFQDNTASRRYGLQSAIVNSGTDPANVYTTVTAKAGDCLGILGYVGGSTEAVYSFQLVEWEGDL